MRKLLNPDRLAVGLPVGLLLAMVAAHTWLVHRHQLSPWLGAGFGMFSSYDGPGNRFVRVFAEADGLRWSVETPDGPNSVAYNVAALPRHDRLAALAQALLDDPAMGLTAIDALRIEVWRASLSGRPIEAQAELLATYEHRPNHDGR